MRILATVEKYAPAIGGSERLIQRVAEGLAARGHEMHVLTGGEPSERELGGVTVHRLALSGNEVRGIDGDRGAVVQTVERIAPELVFNYAAQTWPTDCCYELLDRPGRPRMVLAPCGFSRLHSRRYRGYYRAMPERLRSYDAVILHSRVYQDWRFASESGAHRLFVVPNGADPPDATEARLPTRADGQRPLAVTVGSHVLSKGHADFARAVSAIRRARPLTGLIVAPPRRGLDALRGCQLACEMRARADRVELLDGSAPETVGAALRAADLFLFTSRIECAPLVILEAMAHGTPWVSYDVGNVSELAGGVVVRDRDEQVRAALDILDGRRPELGAEGHDAWQAGHRWQDVVDRYESVFAEVLETADVAGG